jgi:hypothetical protein
MHVLVRASARLRRLLPVLPGKLLRILLDGHQQKVLARNPAVQTGYVVQTFSRGFGPAKRTFWTGCWSAADS